MKEELNDSPEIPKQGWSGGKGGTGVGGGVGGGGRCDQTPFTNRLRETSGNSDLE